MKLGHWACGLLMMVVTPLSQATLPLCEHVLLDAAPQVPFIRVFRANSGQWNTPRVEENLDAYRNYIQNLRWFKLESILNRGDRLRRAQHGSQIALVFRVNGSSGRIEGRVLLKLGEEAYFEADLLPAQMEKVSDFTNEIEFTMRGQTVKRVSGLSLHHSPISVPSETRVRLRFYSRSSAFPQNGILHLASISLDPLSVLRFSVYESLEDLERIGDSLQNLPRKEYQIQIGDEKKLTSDEAKLLLRFWMESGV